MKTNEIKSGMRIKLDNGWCGTMKDNKKGNIRMAEIEGIYTEIGSVYSYNIKQVLNPETQLWEAVEYTDAQLKLKSKANKFGF